LFGPGDFTVLSGIPGQFDHPDIRAAKQRVAAAAKNAGKHWGTICTSPQQIEEAVELGARVICYGADILIIKRGLEQIRDECKALGFSFDSSAESRVTL
jgi:4-hydroxy-2-oxoheptanedioate aldolase